jgi:hypothetical protein
LSDCGDRQLANYAKTTNTKHQFCFEAVERCEDFPFGVKTTYRAYSADEVIEIHQQQDYNDNNNNNNNGSNNNNNISSLLQDQGEPQQQHQQLQQQVINTV